MCFCKSLMTYIILKLMNFTCLGIFVNFLLPSTPQKASMFSHKGRSKEHLSISYFIKGRFSHSGRKLKKAAYFWKTDELELWERNQKKKKRNQKEDPIQEGLHESRATGCAFEKRSTHIFRNLNRGGDWLQYYILLFIIWSVSYIYTYTHI